MEGKSFPCILSVSVDIPIWALIIPPIKQLLWKKCIFPDRGVDAGDIIDGYKNPQYQSMPRAVYDKEGMDKYNELEDRVICQNCTHVQCIMLVDIQNNLYLQKVQVAQLEGKPIPPRPDEETIEDVEEREYERLQKENPKKGYKPVTRSKRKYKIPFPSGNKGKKSNKKK